MQILQIIFNLCNFLLPLSVIEFRRIMSTIHGKQERMVVHLEIGDRHYYYGNLKALCDHWGKDTIGVGYTYLRNYGICEEKPFKNLKCIIRRGIIVTSKRTGQ